MVGGAPGDVRAPHGSGACRSTAADAQAGVGGWRPWGVALAAFFFGTLQRLTLDLQGSQSEFLDSPLVGLFLRMAPYLGAIVVLVLVTRFKKRLGAPEGLGKPA